MGGKRIRGRFTESDLQLLKIFKDSEELILSLRKFFYQEETKFTEVFKNNKPLYEVLYKLFMPEIDSDAPIHENPSRWIDIQYLGFITAETKVVVVAKQDSIEFIRNGVNRIKDLSEGRADKIRELNIDLKMQKDYSSLPAEVVRRAILAWQFSTAFVEERLGELRALAELETQSMEQLIEKTKKNNSK